MAIKIKIKYYFCIAPLIISGLTSVCFTPILLALELVEIAFTNLSLPHLTMIIEVNPELSYSITGNLITIKIVLTVFLFYSRFSNRRNTNRS